MNPIFGWTLALIAVVAGMAIYGWPGLLLALTIVTFWLLLQFSQVMRVMRGANAAPVGHVDSAVMLNAKLHRGMRMLDVVKLTRSLGRQADSADAGADAADVFAWSDTGGSRVTATFVNGRLQSWQLERPSAEP